MTDNAQVQQLVQTVSNLSSDEEKKKSVDEIRANILEKVFKRISNVLTLEDMEKARQIDKDDSTGNAVKYFLTTKVPNLEAIIQEETEAYKPSPSV
ncbi:MAG: hypothetical protein HYT83_04040 [Candidatus Levybacteria bacterium]|nr:hypothetical protein [Candidatus Levybacteria bacterium]